MKATLPFLTCLAFFLSIAGPLHAIKITVPEQYEEQVEAIKQAERAERERALQGIDTEPAADASAGTDAAKTSTSGGLEFSVAGDEDGASESEAGKTDFLAQSLDEAERTVGDFEQEAPEGKGFVSGQIVDNETTRPVAGVAIIMEGTDVGTITDAQGRYTLGPAPAGEYTLSFIKSGYIEANVTEFNVVAGEVSVFPFALPPRPAEMSDEVYVLQDFTVTADEANDLMMKIEIKMSSDRALDIFSSEDFSKFAASDVADAVKKIAGVSVTDGKFPSVRGLNDRYTATSLNGMPLPSPDPFRKSPQLDIFPSNLLDQIVVSKSATADLDGESTAANFDLITKALPEEFFLDVGVGTGFNSNSIDKFRTFDRGGDEYLVTDGVGSGSLNVAPRSDPLQPLADPGFTPSRKYSSSEKDAPLNSSISISTGNTFEFFNDRKLGVIFSFYHKRDTDAVIEATESQGYDFAGADRLETQTIIIGSPPLPPGFPPIITTTRVQVPLPYGDETNYDYEEYTETVRLGGLGGVSYQFNQEHSIGANFFVSRTNDSVVSRYFNGQNPNENITPADDLLLLRERLYFVERSLTLGQIGGDHEFNNLFGFEPQLSWRFQRARTTQDEPDLRDTVAVYRYSDFPANAVPESIPDQAGDPAPRNVNSDDNIAATSNSWRFLQEDEDSGRADLSFLTPIDQLGIDLGGLYRRADRSTDIQSYLENRSDADPTGATPAGLGISSGNLQNGSNAIRGSSTAEREVDAAYLMARLEPNDWLNLNFGYRFEESLINVDSVTLLPNSNSLAGLFREYDSARNKVAPSPADLARAEEADVLSVPNGFASTTGTSLSSSLPDRVYLPSFTATIDPMPGIQIKLGYYETINRPSFREITPDIFIDTEDGDFLAGNPFLTSSTSESRDARLEIYPGRFEVDVPFFDKLFVEEDMFGISLFEKEIINPIEFIRPTALAIDEIPFNNPEGASADGFEIEWSKNLGFVPLPFFEHLSVGGNYAKTTAVAGVSSAELALLGLNNNVDGSQVGADRPLTEQPEEIINLNVSFEHPDWGTTVTLAYNETSEILESIGSEEDFDAYRGPVERLDLIVSQKFENGWKLSFSVKNLMDDGYETYFRNRAPDTGSALIGNLADPTGFGSDLPRKTVDSVGRSYSFSASYSF